MSGNPPVTDCLTPLVNLLAALKKSTCVGYLDVLGRIRKHLQSSSDTRRPPVAFLYRIPVCVSEKVCRAELIKPAMGMPRLSCSSFCLSASLPLVFVFNLAWVYFLKPFASCVLVLEVLNHFVLPWMHRIRWSPYCGCLCVDGRQAPVMEGS